MEMFDRILDAQKRLTDVIERTPLIPASDLSAGSMTYIKAENLQKTGSFKLRGAHNRISRLSDEEKAKGVVACSAGNHAQGVAYSARSAGIKSVICMPAGTPISKIERTRALGAEIELVPGVYDDAYARALELQKEFGYTMIHPFDDLDVIAGQGTVALEILEQAPGVDAVLVPVGGGGLISGIVSAIKEKKPSCKVYGVEAVGAASLKAALENRSVVSLDTVSTIADGIAVKRVSDETFRICRQYVDDVVTVKEGEIASAILRILEDYKIMAEGAGAVSVAAAMYGKVDLRGKQVVCVLSGGNVDVNLIAQIIARGLKKTRRVITVRTVLDDKPRQLCTLLGLFSDAGGNVQSVHHSRADADLDIGQCVVDVELETRGLSHAMDIEKRLKESGYVSEILK